MSDFIHTEETMDDVLDGAMQVLDEEEVIFTDQEWDLFERRIEEGYDLPPSGRYLLWLKMYHCELIQPQGALIEYCLHCPYQLRRGSVMY